MRQIVGELYLRAFFVCASVLKDAVHHPRAVLLEFPVFSHSAECLWRPVCCALLALRGTQVSTRMLGVNSSGAPSLRAMAGTALVSAVTEGSKAGSATWATLAAVVRKLQYAVKPPGLWALLVSRRSTESASLIWDTTSGCMVVG